jgi:hypothetical protein
MLAHLAKLKSSRLRHDYVNYFGFRTRGASASKTLRSVQFVFADAYTDKLSMTRAGMAAINSVKKMLAQVIVSSVSEHFDHVIYPANAVDLMWPIMWV